MSHLRLIVVLCILFFSNLILAQVVLQIERFNDPVVEKIYVGQSIDYRTKQMPDSWTKQRIIEIKDKEQLIIFDVGYVSVGDITALRKPNNLSKYVGRSLTIFGISWFFWGGVATIKGDYNPGWDTAAIGGLALLGGWALRKAKYKVTNINKYTKLRILDLSWPEPVYMP